MNTWAVFKSNGKQYKVKEGDIVILEKIKKSDQGSVSFDDVLLVKNENLTLGKPVIEKAKVKGKILESYKDKKVRVVKFKPKSRYLRTYGHRQNKIKVLIEKIQL